MTKLKDLPVELLVEIFKWLDSDSKLHARLVCRSWTLLLDSLFLEHNIILSNDTLPYVQNLKLLTPKKVNKLTVKDLNVKASGALQSTVSRSALALEPRSITFARDHSWSDFRTGFSPSRSPASPKGNSEENISNILRLNSGVKCVTFAPGSLNNVRTLSLRGLRMKNLTRLKLSVSLYGRREFQLIRQLEQVKMPALTELDLEVGIFNLNNFVNDQTMFQLLHILTAHPVRRLYLGHFLSSSFDGHLMYLPIPSSPPPAAEKVTALRKKLAEIQLEKLTMKLIPRDGAIDYDLGLYLLSCQRELVDFHMEIYAGRDSNEFKEQARRAILRNCGTLRRIEISCDSYGDRCWLLVNYIDEIWQSFQACPAVQTIDLSSFWIRTLIHPLPAASLVHLILGLIRPNVLLEVCTAAPNLQMLQFSGLAHEDTPDYEAVTGNLIALLGMPKLRVIKWRSDGDVTDYLNGQEGIRITRAVEDDDQTKCNNRRYEYITVTKL